MSRFNNRRNNKNRYLKGNVAREYDQRFGNKGGNVTTQYKYPGDRASKKQRHRQLRKQRWSWDVHVNPIRTLKRAAQKQVSRKTDKKYVRPWIQAPTFRYQEGLVKRASLFGMPFEVREEIWEKCLPVPRAGDNPAQVAQAMKIQVANLSCVDPILRIDMLEVRRRWEKHNQVFLTAPPPPTTTTTAQPPQGPAAVVPPALLLPGNSRPSLVVSARHEGKRLKKCRFCLERHLRKDRFCPRELRGGARWLADSKAWKKREQRMAQKWAQRGFVGGTKIVFDE